MLLSILANFLNLYNSIWGLCIACSVTLVMYWALQRLDFSKLFKPNSTIQIKIVLLFVSLAIGIICALGVCVLINNIASMF